MTGRVTVQKPKESERLAEQGIHILRSHGWPPEAIEEIVTTLMAAGMARWAEEQAERDAANERIIQAVMN